MNEVDDLIHILKINHFSVEEKHGIIYARKKIDSHVAYMTIHRRKMTVRTHGMTIPVHDYLRGMMRK